MKNTELKQQRLVQLLHDPAHKAMVMGSGLSHKAQAQRLAEAVAGQALRAYNPGPDWLATGADRPDLGSSKTVRVDWRKHPEITHPLQAVRMVVNDSGVFGQGAQERIQQITGDLETWWEREVGTPDGEQVWTSDDHLDEIFLSLWRRTDEWLREIGLPMAWLPADSRCPDHSISSHQRMAAAAAFLDRPDRKNRRPEREPMLLQIGIRGVQQAIAESRKTRDLWTACMMYTELVWAAMRVIVEQYGPEVILYPDLRGNPLVDQWLLEQGYADAVPKSVREHGAGTFAAPVPNTFMALVPAGGVGDLPTVRVLAEQCREAVQERWQDMARAVHRFIDSAHRGGRWQEIWDRQLSSESAPPMVWTAVPWKRRMRDAGPPPESLKTLPNQEAADQGSVMVARAEALRDWLPELVWAHYEEAKLVYWATDVVASTGYLTNERGFDYPLVHHQLRVAHAMRKTWNPPQLVDEPGEKCALTGRHEVLSNRPADGSTPWWKARGAAQEFWSHKKLDPDGTGSERLGGPGAVKRFLARSDDPVFVRRWDGIDTRESNPDAPFPSMAGVAAGRFLVKVGQAWSSSPDLRRAAARVIDALKASPLVEATVHPLAQPRLTALGRGRADLQAFYQVEPQYFHPEALVIHRARHGESSAEAGAIQAVIDAVKAFRREAKETGCGTPATGVAVLAMDGDSMSRLILGDPEIIQTTWRDVLHAKAVERIEESSDVLLGWQTLLDAKRHMGPAVHAAITASLAYFVHHVAGWVVECEFGGRLVLAGGDDVLAVLPADEVAHAAARLQQLVSAPWIVDTRPEVAPWSWRRAQGHAASPDGKEERGRFQVPVPRQGRIDLTRAYYERHVAEDRDPEIRPGKHEIVPMLGRNHGMSAGVAVGHYKTPLDRMLQAARFNLNKVAKRYPRRSVEPTKQAIAIDRFTRSGAKVRFCAPWRLGETEPYDPPTASRHLANVAEAFRSGRLASRMPYKLREMVLRAGAVVREEGVAKGLLRKAMDIEDEDLLESCLALFEAGLTQAEDDDDQAMVAGLLLARYLASLAEEDRDG